MSRYSFSHDGYAGAVQVAGAARGRDDRDDAVQRDGHRRRRFFEVRGCLRSSPERGCRQGGERVAQRGPGGDAELGEDLVQVSFDGPERPPPDLLVGQGSSPLPASLLMKRRDRDPPHGMDGDRTSGLTPQYP
jgi:hypothetical protein